MIDPLHLVLVIVILIAINLYRARRYDGQVRREQRASGGHRPTEVLVGQVGTLGTGAEAERKDGAQP